MTKAPSRAAKTSEATAASPSLPGIQRQARALGDAHLYATSISDKHQTDQALRQQSSTLRKEACHQAVRPAAVAVLPGSPLFDKCLLLASNTALPVVNLLQEPAWEMPDHLLQAVWARVVPALAALAGDLPLLQMASSNPRPPGPQVPHSYSPCPETTFFGRPAFCETVHAAVSSCVTSPAPTTSS